MNDRIGLEAAVRCVAAHAGRVNDRYADEAAVRCKTAPTQPINDRSADETDVRFGHKSRLCRSGL